MVDSTVVILTISILIVVLLIAGAPLKPMRFLATGGVKLVIGALFLFFLNIFGASFGIHVPINLVTSVISGFLGLPGIASLIAIHLIVLG